MKIVFIGLNCMFTPGMTYQDNILCTQALLDGHQVVYISNPERFERGTIVPTGPEDTVLPDGLRLIRLPYRRLGPEMLTKKFRSFPGVYEILDRERPDVVFCHNHQYWSIRDVVRYKKDHPAVKLYADTHTAAYNSGTNWLSLHVLHRVFYRYLTQKALPYLEKYFYIGEGERQFSLQNYGVPESLMEFYPLGGTLLQEDEYRALRAKRREELGLREGQLLLIHSGKLDALKRTDELLRAFAAVPEVNARLAVIGSIPEDRKALLSSLMDADGRVVYLGWRSGAELQEYLCACDLYCQPGSRSATLQNAVCRGCAVLSYPHADYTKDLDFGNFLWTKTEEDMADAFRQLAEDPARLEAMKEHSRRCARELLDYRKLVARLYQ